MANRANKTTTATTSKNPRSTAYTAPKTTSGNTQKNGASAATAQKNANEAARAAAVAAQRNNTGVKTAGSGTAAAKTTGNNAAGSAVKAAVNTAASNAVSKIANVGTNVANSVSKQLTNNAGSGGGYTNPQSGAVVTAVQEYYPQTDVGYSGGSAGGTSGGTIDKVPILSMEEFRDLMGTDDYMENVNKYISALVQQARNSYEAQIADTNKDYEREARQAYINNRLGQKNLDQQLAAQGVYGGMADSQRLAMQSGYENELADLDRQRLSAVDELNRAIKYAELTGDQQMAQYFQQYLTELQNMYANYYNNASAQDRAAQYSLEQQLLQDRQTMEQMAYQNRLNAANQLGGFTGSADQIKQMQAALGVTPDGVWGPVSSAAAGGLSAAEAWQMYLQAYGG